MKNIDEKILMAEEEIKQLQNKRKKLIMNIPVRRSRYSGKVETACPE